MDKLIFERYETNLTIIICIMLLCTLLYSIKNTIELKKLNINYDNKLLELNDIYKKNDDIINIQNKLYSNLINQLKENHKKNIINISKEKLTKKSNICSSEINKYFTSKIIPNVKKTLEKNNFKNVSSNTITGDLYENNVISNDDRWSLI